MDLSPLAQKQIPSSKCPQCGTLHQFHDVDMTDPPKGSRPLGHGAVFVCHGCAMVLQIQANLTLELVDLGEAYLQADEVVNERWKVIKLFGLTEIPEDLAHTALTHAPAEFVVMETEPDRRVASLFVWPTMPIPEHMGVAVDFGYVVSITREPADLELIVTGTTTQTEPDANDPVAYRDAAAEALFSVINAAWPTIDEHVDWAAGQRFTFDEGGGYEYVLAPVDPKPLSLPTSRYVQVLWPSVFGWWPWDEKGEWMPVLAGPEWRPSTDEVVTIPHPDRIDGQVDPSDAPLTPIDVSEII